METVQQNGRFTLFSSKFLSIYSILYGHIPPKEPSPTRETFNAGRTRGFKGSDIIPENCDFLSQFDLLNIIFSFFLSYTFMSAYAI